MSKRAEVVPWDGAAALGAVAFVVAFLILTTGALAGEPSMPEILAERKCASDSECAAKAKAGKGQMHPTRPYICQSSLCVLGCRTDRVCVDATGNSSAKCVSQNCYVPAWMGP